MNPFCFGPGLRAVMHGLFGRHWFAQFCGSSDVHTFHYTIPTKDPWKYSLHQKGPCTEKLSSIWWRTQVFQNPSSWLKAPVLLLANSASYSPWSIGLFVFFFVQENDWKYPSQNNQLVPLSKTIPWGKKAADWALDLPEGSSSGGHRASARSSVSCRLIVWHPLVT